MKKKILVAVAWPYVNGPMHIGHVAGAYVAADIFARYHRLIGNDVLMVSGSDMHGTPTTVVAEKEGVEPLVIANRYHERMKKTLENLGTSFDLYTTTETKNHREISQKIFLTLLEKGYIFKDTMMQMYCEYDKRFLPDRFVEGTCPHCGFGKARGDQCDNCGRTLDPKDLIDPTCKICGRTPVEKETEHFFLDLPAFSDKLTAYLSTKDYWRANVREFPLSWIKEGLKPRPITRDMNYGIPVPVKGYENKVLYVWFEAVIGYLSASIEWAEAHNKEWEPFWRDPVHAEHYYFLGKDNIPFHTIIWPAILMGYDSSYNLPYEVAGNENLNLEGKKFSKSTGHYIEADHLIDTYGAEALRYYVSSIMPETKDTDFTWKGFIDAINNELVANLGNLVNRNVTFIDKNFEGKVPEGTIDQNVIDEIQSTFSLVGESVEHVRFQQGINQIMKLSQFGNRYFDSQKPWVSPKESGTTLYNMVQLISALSILLEPYLPKTAEKMQQMLGITKHGWEYVPVKAGTKIQNPGLLFSKVDEEQIEKEKELMKPS
jgi:methionyl-tRNA synthetase